MRLTGWKLAEKWRWHKVSVKNLALGVTSIIKFYFKCISKLYRRAGGQIPKLQNKHSAQRRMTLNPGLN